VINDETENRVTRQIVREDRAETGEEYTSLIEVVAEPETQLHVAPDAATSD
jgi:hypothetical protein